MTSFSFNSSLQACVSVSDMLHAINSRDDEHNCTTALKTRLPVVHIKCFEAKQKEQKSCQTLNRACMCVSWIFDYMFTVYVTIVEKTPKWWEVGLKKIITHHHSQDNKAVELDKILHFFTHTYSLLDIRFCLVSPLFSWQIIYEYH